MMATTLRATSVRADVRLLIAGAAWVCAALFALAAVTIYSRHGALGGDAFAYWRSGHTANLYDRSPATWGAYLYSPAFAQLVKPLTLLPEAAFASLWIAGEAAAFVWLVRPLGVRWGVPVFLACVPELAWGNLYGFYAVVLVVGFTRPAAWALPALTKITPAVGPIWFAARREWRALAITVGTTAAIALVSFAIAPDQWRAWVSFLQSNAGRPATLARYAVGAGLAVVAARRRTPWLLAPAMVLASPMFGEATFSLLAAVPRLAQMGMPQPRQPLTLVNTST